MAKLLTSFLSLILLVGCADIASDPSAPSAPHLLADAQPGLQSAIQLQFPLRDGNGEPGDPYTWPVNAVFDHSMPLGAFCPDVNDDKLVTRVVAFTGEEGAGRERDGDGVPGVKGWKLRSSVKGTCGKGPTLQGYAGSGGGFFLGPDGLRGTSDDPVNYTGSSYLSYDGHPGLDYRARFIPVYAAAEGTVVSASGCRVEIQHANGYSTVYDHLSAILVGQGWVTLGQRIGVSGECGAKGAPHLHFGVKLNGVEVDPYGWTGTGADPYTVLTGVINTRLWPPPLLDDLMHQLDHSQVMTNATFPDAALTSGWVGGARLYTLVGQRTADVSAVEFYVQSAAGSVNWSCQDRDFGNPNPTTAGPYAYFGSHISENNGGASVMTLRTIPNANQTIHNYASIRIVEGHSYYCAIFNSLANGSPDTVNPIDSRGNGRDIYIRVSGQR